MTSRILPAFYPDLSYFEEGCIRIGFGDLNMIVSPDGSCKDNLTEMTKMAIEVKCPSPCSPGSYKVPVFYTIQKYYVPQILSEMYALQTDELLFICYSHDSTTVMKATFCLKLWQAMFTDVMLVRRKNQHKFQF